MADYQSVVEWQRPGAPAWSCDSLLLLRFTPELIRALQEVTPGSALAAAPPPAVAGRAAGITSLSYDEVERAQGAYQRASGAASSGLAAVLAQMQGLRAKGLAVRFVYWQSERKSDR
jgi:hypothetical protein